ncbi:hypothetical protein COB64_01615 [Candidatus Wolfebacteria bacterium]|nr:MAG: hypothetical protein COB64_01615 [Candidatus Wolfebacteria bacterium]
MNSYGHIRSVSIVVIVLFQLLTSNAYANSGDTIATYTSDSVTFVYIIADTDNSFIKKLIERSEVLSINIMKQETHIRTNGIQISAKYNSFTEEEMRLNSTMSELVHKLDSVKARKIGGGKKNEAISMLQRDTIEIADELSEFRERKKKANIDARIKQHTADKHTLRTQYDIAELYNELIRVSRKRIKEENNLIIEAYKNVSNKELVLEYSDQDIIPLLKISVHRRVTQ